jgi:hypothetical protein
MATFNRTPLEYSTLSDKAFGAIGALDFVAAHRITVVPGGLQINVRYSDQDSDPSELDKTIMAVLDKEGIYEQLNTCRINYI